MSQPTYSANIPRFLVYNGISIGFWLPIWVIYYQQRGLNLVEIGLLEFGHLGVLGAGRIPTGALADRFGRRLCLALGALLMGVSVLAITGAWAGAVAVVHHRGNPVAGVVHADQRRRYGVALRLARGRWP